MEENKNLLWKEDEILFKSMEDRYQTNNEANFFRNLRYKQEYEVALSNDLLISEHDNNDYIYFVRVEYDEYIVGCGIGEKNQKEIHVMNLSEALSVRLRTLGYQGEDISLLQWLRQRDYNSVMYDHNYDLI